MLFCACSQPPVKDRPVHDRLDAYELAFHLYFREEKKEKAIDLLTWACQSLEDQREVSCYDLGQILVREGRMDDAVNAFALSYKIRPNGPALSSLYELWAAGFGPEPPSAPRLVRLAKGIERSCRAGRKSEAMAALQAAGSDVPRELFTQPFFAECLAGPEFAAAVSVLTPRPVPIELIYRQRAEAHALHSVFDVAPYLHAEALAYQSTHPVNSAWRSFVEAAKAGNAAGAERFLALFYSALESKRTSDGRVDSQILAMKRAAGTLIAGDIFFVRVRNSQRIQKMVNDSLPGSGIFASR